MAHSGLFLGLVTLDLIYLCKELPGPNQKVVALDYTVASGGPAINAAVTFSYLGNIATSLGAIGNHPITQLIRADLTTQAVAIADLVPEQPDPPPVSSILVTQATGERAVVSLNAQKHQATPGQIPPDILRGVAVVLIDGHQMAVGRAIAEQARSHSIPVVVDGGSWKPGFEQVLALTDYAVCSANFHPPGCDTTATTFAYLRDLGIPHIAITHGGNPIEYCTDGQMGSLSVPPIKPVDTLGAGDIFHGAFCSYILKEGFVKALLKAAEVAAAACQFFGTRRWLEHHRKDGNGSG